MDMDVLQCRVWAVCGDMLNEEKFAVRIVRCLRRNNYTVFPVMSGEHENIYIDFDSMPEKPQVLVLCTRPDYGTEAVKEAIKAGIKHVWAQPGARSDEIRQICEDNKVQYHEDCIMTKLTCGL